MVYDLSLLGRQVEMTVHLIIVEGTDAGSTEPKCLSGDVHTLANSCGFKMHVAITTVAKYAGGTIEIADHRKDHAGVTARSCPRLRAAAATRWSPLFTCSNSARSGQNL